MFVNAIRTIFKGKHIFQPTVFSNLVTTFSIVLDTYVEGPDDDLSLVSLVKALEDYKCTNGQQLKVALNHHRIWRLQATWHRFDCDLKILMASFQLEPKLIVSVCGDTPEVNDFLEEYAQGFKKPALQM